MHEKYKYPSHDYDISVLELSRPVSYTNAVHKICLPDASHEFRPGDEMFVTGFGALQNDGEHLRRKSNHSNLIWYAKAFKEWNAVMPLCWWVGHMDLGQSGPTWELSDLEDM